MRCRQFERLAIFCVPFGAPTWNNDRGRPVVGGTGKLDSSRTKGARPVLKATQFIAMVLTALTLVPLGAHLAELPNKIHLAQVDYFIAQSMYRGWALFGVIVVGALIANLALAMLLRWQSPAFVLVVVNLLCVTTTLAIFFAFTYPANIATDNWTTIPAGWQRLRWQWEASHAVNAAIAFAGFCALTWSLLLTRE